MKNKIPKYFKKIKSAQDISVRRAQDKQDEIFRKMSANKKIKLSSGLTMFCLKLNKLGGNYKPRKIIS